MKMVVPVVSIGAYMTFIFLSPMGIVSFPLTKTVFLAIPVKPSCALRK